VSKTTIRKKVEMSRSSDDKVTVTLHNDYTLTIKHSNINYGGSKHEFDNFDTVVSFFRQTIDALYLDGYR